MSTVIDQDFESGSSLATLGFRNIVAFANTSGKGLRGSTWGAYGAGLAYITIGIAAGQAFFVSADVDNALYSLGADNFPLQMFSGAIGSNSFTLTLHSGDYDDGVNPVILKTYWLMSSAVGFGSIPVWVGTADMFTVGVTQNIGLCGVLSSAPLTLDGSVKIVIDAMVIASFAGMDLSGNGFHADFAELFINPGGSLDNLLVNSDGCTANTYTPPPDAPPAIPRKACRPDTTVLKSPQPSAGCNIGGVGWPRPEGR